MSIRSAPILVGILASLTMLGGCASSTKLSDLWAPKSDEQSAAPSSGSNETTGSIVVPPAEPGASGEPVAPLAKPGLLGDDPNDDLQRGKRYFRHNDFGLAEKNFRAAVERHPRDAEAWVGLAASYDRLRRFDLADRAYQEAIQIIGRTPGSPQQPGIFLYPAGGLCAGAKDAPRGATKGSRQSLYPCQYGPARRKLSREEIGAVAKSFQWSLRNGITLKVLTNFRQIDDFEGGLVCNDRRSKPDRRSLLDRLSPCDRFSSSDRISTARRRSLPARLLKLDRLLSSAIDVPPLAIFNNCNS